MDGDEDGYEAEGVAAQREPPRRRLVDAARERKPERQRGRRGQDVKEDDERHELWRQSKSVLQRIWRDGAEDGAAAIRERPHECHVPGHRAAPDETHEAQRVTLGARLRAKAMAMASIG